MSKKAKEEKTEETLTENTTKERQPEEAVKDDTKLQLNIKIDEIDACNNLAVKKGRYFISVSLKILIICICTLKPPNDNIIVDRVALNFNGIFNRLMYFNPCVISIKPFKML